MMERMYMYYVIRLSQVLRQYTILFIVIIILGYDNETMNYNHIMIRDFCNCYHFESSSEQHEYSHIKGHILTS